jgi:hypothetical protein
MITDQKLDEFLNEIQEELKKRLSEWFFDQNIIESIDEFPAQRPNLRKYDCSRLQFWYSSEAAIFLGLRCVISNCSSKLDTM